ncbi:MAG: DoxX family protein [Phycisphaerae bacterium]|nr:DoxX family protein [Phycisphaerae bacterium]
MKLESSATAGSKLFLIVGWVISAIPILMMGVGGIVMAATNPQMVEKGMVDHGYPGHLAHTILALEIGCAVIYAIPQTAVLGAILMTGYLGGATATHVRVEETQWIMPVIFGVMVWLGLFLRDQRLRVLLPIRR